MRYNISLFHGEEIIVKLFKSPLKVIHQLVF
jgi:hypothetical protein